MGINFRQRYIVRGDRMGEVGQWGGEGVVVEGG